MSVSFRNTGMLQFPSTIKVCFTVFFFFSCVTNEEKLQQTTTADNLPGILKTLPLEDEEVIAYTN